MSLRNFSSIDRQQRPRADQQPSRLSTIIERFGGRHNRAKSSTTRSREDDAAVTEANPIFLPTADLETDGDGPNDLVTNSKVNTDDKDKSECVVALGCDISVAFDKLNEGGRSLGSVIGVTKADEGVGDNPGKVFNDGAHASICSNSEPSIGSDKRILCWSQGHRIDNSALGRSTTIAA